MKEQTTKEPEHIIQTVRDPESGELHPVGEAPKKVNNQEE